MPTRPPPPSGLPGSPPAAAFKTRRSWPIPHLLWFGDIIPVPWPLPNVLSVGDLIIYVGAPGPPASRVPEETRAEPATPDGVA